MDSSNGKNKKEPIKLKLSKETVQELDMEVLSMVSGGVTYGCCAGCSTDGTSTWCGSGC